MPFFHQSFYQNFGCTNKYLQSAQDIGLLSCPKSDISMIWESNAGKLVSSRGPQLYGCLNQRCCLSMISFVKGKFNFLAAFCIVALIFITVAIMNAHYMYKKIRKMNTLILIHRTDNTLLGIMVAFTIILGVVVNQSLPDKPEGMP
jgi:hypothetical protein